MLIILIAVAVFLLFLMVPLGVDAAYRKDTFYLRIRLGPVWIQVLPDTEAKAPKKEKKKKEKEKKDASSNGRASEPGKDDILDGLRLVLDGLSRFRRCLSIDLLRLSFVCAAPDPYDAVMQYGYANALFSLLSPLLHRALKIRDEEIVLDLDVTADTPGIDAQIVASSQIWEIFYIGFPLGFGLLHWFHAYQNKAKE